MRSSPIRSSGTRRRLIVGELGTYGVVGVACLVLQLAVFQLLYAGMGVGAVTAKLVAALLGMTAAYFAHRTWSFRHRPRGGGLREYAVFAAINVATLLVGAAVVAVVRHPLGQEGTVVLQAANIASIVLCTVLRYLAYRRWVFRDRPPAADPFPMVGVPAVRT